MYRIFLLLLSILPLKLMAISIEGKVSYFRPTDKHVRQIYGNAWVDYGFTIDHLYVFKHLSVFIEGNFLQKSGRSLHGNQKTNIWIVPVTAGLKWIQPINSHFDIYFGIAPRYFFLHLENQSQFVPKTQNRNGMGGYATAGAFIHIKSGFFLDLFVDYSYKKFSRPSKRDHLQRFTGDISGLDAGAGLGYLF